MNAYGLGKKPGMTGGITNKRVSKRSLAVTALEAFPKNTFRHIESLKFGKFGKKTAGRVALFLLEVAALELVRRFSKAKCPFAWRGLQALQLVCYPPFKWIQRWAPFNGLVKGMQMLSSPLFVLSIATAFSDKSECGSETSDGFVNSDVSELQALTEPQSHVPPEEPILGTRVCDDATPQNLSSETWMLQLYTELENQRITLPERINEDELRRFYTAANEDSSHLLSSIKKTIHWRETYKILSGEELEMWSNLVFWHGFDVNHRPCLVIRLGLACLTLPSHDRPRYAQALVSQIEHGVLHLVDAENPQIAVLIDCEGLSPLNIPMKMLRSCCALLQDHFPNRLGCLFVIRLPPVVRVIAQTFLQVLKPLTRQKLRIEGGMFRSVLSEYLVLLPSYLGSNCTCMQCSKIAARKMEQLPVYERREIEPISDAPGDEGLSSSYLEPAISDRDYSRMLRTAVIGMLIFWVFIALMAGLCGDESPLLPPPEP